MGSNVQFKPDIALRRAREMQNIGLMREACAMLFDVLVSKRMGRLWVPAHEHMMMEFINLCTDLRETRRTKDGLYFYRQLTQMQSPASLEKVVNHMIDSALQKAKEAHERAAIDPVRGTAVADLDDDEEQSPESMLMGAVTAEGARERAEREVLVPWLRHVWDTFRNVLENIRYVPRLEMLYHTVIARTMSFCRDYNRTSEFKKLCTMLRNHLQAQRRSQEMNGGVMTQEQIERHLTTRFTQLEKCADLALWTEGFRTIEDINLIMSFTDAPPKAQLMATYFEKLARIFWVSENYLFHAYAWYKFYTLSVTHNKALAEEDKRAMASAAVLAALAIPLYSSGPAGTSASYNTSTAASPLDVDDERDKKAKLAALLKHAGGVPSREALFSELIAKGVLRLVRPEVATLFRLLEVEFHPLNIVERVAPLVARVRLETTPTLNASGTLGAGVSSASAHTLAQYAINVERLLVFRMLEQLTAVYSTVKLAHFHSLLGGGVSMSMHDVEKLIVRAVRNRQLVVRIDHRAGCLRLGNDAMETANTRRQVVELAARLHAVADRIKPEAVAATSVVSRAKVAQLFEHARETLDVVQNTALNRKNIIEKRKEMAERQRQMEEREAIERRIKDEQTRQAAEAARQAEEAAKREAANAQRIRDQQETDNLRRLMTAAGQDASSLDVDKLQQVDRKALEREMREKAAKVRDEEAKRRAEQAKRADFLVRALRDSERVKLQEYVRSQLEEDVSYVTAIADARLATAKETHEKAALNKLRLMPMVAHQAKFEEKVFARRRAAYEDQRVGRIAREREQYMRSKHERAVARRDKALREAAEAESRRKAMEAEAETKRKEHERMLAEAEEAEAEAAARRPIPTASDNSSNWRRDISSAPAPTPAAAEPSSSWRRGAGVAAEPAPAPAAPAAYVPPRLRAAAAAQPQIAATPGAYVPPSRRGAAGDAPPPARVESAAPPAPAAAVAPVAVAGAKPSWRDRMAAKQ